MTYLLLLLQYLLPQHFLSKLMGITARSHCVWLKNFIILWFIKKYKVDLSEAQKTDPQDYESFQDFFTRKLADNARPISTDSNSIITPVDGRLTQMGSIQEDLLLQAKGKTYTLDALLAIPQTKGFSKRRHQAASHRIVYEIGEDGEWCRQQSRTFSREGDNQSSEPFHNGQFITFYLSPRDYHRVHMPMDGTLQKMAYVPGKLFSVNDTSSAHIHNLFARNERLICWFKTSIGPMVLIMVGALLVSGIHTSWAGKVHTSHITIWKYTNRSTPISIVRGDELGYFAFGSTVIVLFPEQTIDWNQKLIAGKKLLMGQSLGNCSYTTTH
jgi:phosphatidylserine decarboxylase